MHSKGRNFETNKSMGIGRFLLFFAVAVLGVESVDAQILGYARPKYEGRLAWGTTAFFGDVGSAPREGLAIPGLDGTDLSMVQPAYLFGIKRNFKKKGAIRLNLLFTRVEGSDYHARSESVRERNLSFRTPVSEFSAMYEYTVVNFLRKKSSTNVFEYYIFGGAGVTHFEPYAEYMGEWVKLRPLGTEGQGLIPGTKLYSSFTPVIPVGGGLRFNYRQNVMIFGELTYRQTSTDYMDDVSSNYYNYEELFNARGHASANLSYRGKSEGYPSGNQRGNPHSKDAYLTLTIGIVHQLGKGRIAPNLNTELREDRQTF